MLFLKRKWILTSIIVLIPLGLYTKFYTGPLYTWVNNSFGGVLYVIFWSVLVFLFIPKISPWIICGFVLVITSILEFLQLWHPDFLELLRSGFLGRALLGTTFSGLDFLHYIFGFIIAGLLLSFIKKVEINHF